MRTAREGADANPVDTEMRTNSTHDRDLRRQISALASSPEGRRSKPPSVFMTGFASIAQLELRAVAQAAPNASASARQARW